MGNIENVSGDREINLEGDQIEWPPRKINNIVDIDNVHKYEDDREGDEIRKVEVVWYDNTKTLTNHIPDVLKYLN